MTSPRMPSRPGGASRLVGRACERRQGLHLPSLPDHGLWGSNTAATVRLGSGCAPRLTTERRVMSPAGSEGGAVLVPRIARRGHVSAATREAL